MPAGFGPLASIPLNSPTLSLPSTTDARLPITYTLVSGPATLSGDLLTFSGPGPVTVMATQAGDGTHAPLTALETILAAAAEIDTPTMPVWGLILMGLAARARRAAAGPRACSGSSG